LLNKKVTILETSMLRTIMKQTLIIALLLLLSGSFAVAQTGGKLFPLQSFGKITTRIKATSKKKSSVRKFVTVSLIGILISALMCLAKRFEFIADTA